MILDLCVVRKYNVMSPIYSETKGPSSPIIKTMYPEQNGRQFVDNSFKCILQQYTVFLEYFLTLVL